MPVFGSEISFTLPSTAVWLCVSMIPGITNLPAASMTRAGRPVTCAFVPTAAIFPPWTRIDPCSIFPCETVRMVASRMTMSCAPATVAMNRNASARRGCRLSVIGCLGLESVREI